MSNNKTEKKQQQQPVLVARRLGAAGKHDDPDFGEVAYTQHMAAVLVANHKAEAPPRTPEGQGTTLPRPDAPLRPTLHAAPRGALPPMRLVF